MISHEKSSILVWILGHCVKTSAMCVLRFPTAKLQAARNTSPSEDGLNYQKKYINMCKSGYLYRMDLEATMS
jgi:predicted DNA binding CopG/RHH family protein